MLVAKVSERLEADGGHRRVGARLPNGAKKDVVHASGQGVSSRFGRVHRSPDATILGHEASRDLLWQPALREVNGIGADCSRDVDPVIDNEHDASLADAFRSLQQVPSRQAAANVDRNVAGACDGHQAFVEVWESKDCVVSDRVESRKWIAHLKRAPRLAPRPRNQSLAAIRARPAGWTSRNWSAPSPVEITKAGSVSVISPGRSSVR